MKYTTDCIIANVCDIYAGLVLVLSGVTSIAEQEEEGVLSPYTQSGELFLFAILVPKNNAVA